MVLEHAGMTDFCGIPLVSLRENTITKLDLNEKGVGVPGAIVLSKLLPSAAAVKSLKCAAAPECLLLCQRPLTEKQTPLCAHRLSSNFLGPEGGAALAEGIKGNSNLQSLS